MNPRHILIACDKFKGSLSAQEACEAIARGLAARWPAATLPLTLHPIADGGEGFAQTLLAPLKGRWVDCPAHDALGRPLTARYLLADAADGPLAVMEMAEASGLWRIPAADRDILAATTIGTGEMMRHAITTGGARRIVLGIGGSATNDGGAGMAAALGVRFLAADNSLLHPSPLNLARHLARVDASGLIPLPPVTAACDVSSPLLGPAGATRVFGPQKGADAASTPVLEAALEKLTALTDGADLADVAGAGAAGGLGFGLLRFVGAELVPGFDLLASLTGLTARIAAADLVITGEGRLDAQTLTGKGPAGIASLARAHGTPVWAFCGSAEPVARQSGLFQHVIELAASGLALPELLAGAAGLLESLAASSPADY